MQVEVAAEGLSAVFDPDQAGAVDEVRAAAAVVADADMQVSLARADLDVGGGGASVLGDVSECLGDRVVSGDFDRLGQPLVYLDVEVNRDGGPACQRPQRRAQ